MDDTITTIYCLCDDFLKAISHHRDDPRTRLSTAEVMTIPLVASTFFGGNIDKTRRFLGEYGYMRESSRLLAPGLGRADGDVVFSPSNGFLI